MAFSDQVLTVARSIGLLSIAVATIPAFDRVVRFPSSRKRLGAINNARLYEDEDGVATEETQKLYLRQIPRAYLLVSSAGGFLAALVTTFGIYVQPGRDLAIEDVLQCAAWAFIYFHCVNIYLERRPVVRFNLAIYGAVSSIALLTVVCINLVLLVRSTQRVQLYSCPVMSRVIEAMAASLCLWKFSTIPRRPEVTKDGRSVDGLFTVSVLGRYTFASCENLLTKRAKQPQLNAVDFPKLGRLARSEVLYKSVKLSPDPIRLWRHILGAHWPKFLWQWTLTLITALTAFVPPFALYNILRLLELRDQGRPLPGEAWIWVLVLGLIKSFQCWIEQWLIYFSSAFLVIPIWLQLCIQVFGKALRRKDIKAVHETEVDQENEQGLEVDNKVTDRHDPEDDNSQSSQQAQTNLIGLDAEMVSSFCYFNTSFPDLILRVIISLCFLAKILGWQSLLGGVAVVSLLFPLKLRFAKEFAKAEDDLMKEQDHKARLITEALRGIRQIKFSALEREWQTRIGKVRQQELKMLWLTFLLDTGLVFCWICSPILLAAVTLTIHALVYGGLSASVAFTALEVLTVLEVTLQDLPENIVGIIDAVVSCRRIERYLNSPEKEDSRQPANSIVLMGASVAWARNDTDKGSRFELHDLNLAFPDKELSVISGKTGSGKSLLLASIIGEADILSGIVNVPRHPRTSEQHDHRATYDNWVIASSIAFVPQIPWIESATIKDNVLFGLPYYPDRYGHVLEACALNEDIEMLADRDLTEIGENGINLSGGQRWRVSFARALYSRAGILVLDDIFSAVDAEVGRHLLEHGLIGSLSKGRTRLLVTHHLGLALPHAKYVVQLEQGTAKGEYVDELAVAEHGVDVSLSESLDLTKKHSLSWETRESEQIKEPHSLDLQPRKFIEEEARATGRVKWTIYKEYMKATGGAPVWILTLVLFIGYEGALLGRAWWIKQWTQATSHQTNSFISNTYHAGQQAIEPIKSTLSTYVGVYISISLIACFLGTFRYFWILYLSIRGTKVVFEKLLYTVLRAPSGWLDRTPVGRILNRFTNDFGTLDRRTGTGIGFLCYYLIQMVGIIVASLFVSPYTALAAVSLFLASLHLATRYLAGARDVKRLQSTEWSPIFDQFGSVLTGLSTIRAFGKVDDYLARMYILLDNFAQADWHLMGFNQWMSLRFSLLGTGFVTLVAILILSTQRVDASLAGFALSFALELNNAIIYALQHYSSTELQLTSTERIMEYANMEVEDQSGVDPPAAWPHEGTLEVEDLVVKYAEDVPPILKGVSFTVEKNQRIGVVGRTGAGKSTLTLAVFRFLKASGGSIRIDGLDISTIKLYHLRSRLAIVPQDPVLFSGTVRSNLDPFDEHDDSVLYEALRRVHLSSHTSDNEVPGSSGRLNSSTDDDTNTNVFDNLSSPISEGGLNLSQGQRQLLCLARAILSQPKLMVLDEATSAVDKDTDLVLQRSIREDFKDSTLLVIAHRLSTIVDFSRILVLEDGKAVEYDSPRRLLENRGAFWRMVAESGEKEDLERTIYGDGGRGSEN